MTSDIKSKTTKTREYKLPLLMAGGLFFLLMLVSMALLTITYVSSQLIVKNNDAKLHEQSGVISALVAETRLEALKHSVDLISEDRNFSNTGGWENNRQRLSYLTNAFYTQRESIIDMLALLSNEGEFLGELSAEAYKFPDIKKEISRKIKDTGSWFLASEEAEKEHPMRVMIYYKREMLNNITGKVEGILVGGIFVNSNHKLINEIKKRSGAQFVAITRNGNILSTAGKISTRLTGAELNLNMQDLQNTDENVKIYVSKILEHHFPKNGFSVLSAYPASSETTLTQLLFISSSLALALALILSAISAVVGQVMFLKPLKELITYARKVERQDENPQVPQSSIAEFNEVGHNLESVFTAF
ncbi:MAG: cache domain-containing protein, partial [Sneathiella sp.]|nr:cache domain-containing protein [Sneathiella sp.]